MHSTCITDTHTHNLVTLLQVAGAAQLLGYVLYGPGCKSRHRQDVSLLFRTPTAGPLGVESEGGRGGVFKLLQPEVEVKNQWIYTSNPLYAFMAWKVKTLPCDLV